jgi:hypothetical protein
MALTDFAFIVFGWDYDPESDIQIVESETLKTRVVGVDSLESAEAVAVELVADGVQLIELCGWFGPKGAARIIEAVGDQVPVGFVTHGPDSINSLYELFN